MVVSRILFGLTLVSLIAAGVALVLPSAQPASSSPATREPQVVLESSTIELGSVPVGKHLAKFTVLNKSDQQRRILGMAEGCTRGCCYRPKQRAQIVIPPGGRTEYEVEVIIGGAGDFESSFAIFLEENGIREEMLTLRGTAFAPKGNSDAPTDLP